MKHLFFILLLFFSFSLTAQTFPDEFISLTTMQDYVAFYTQEKVNGTRQPRKVTGPVIKSYIIGSGNNRLVNAAELGDSTVSAVTQAIDSAILAGDSIYVVANATLLPSTAKKASLAFNTDGDSLWYWNGSSFIGISLIGGGGGVTDGDKGDIDITGSGTVYTIDTSAVDYDNLSQAVKDSISNSSETRLDIGRLEFIYDIVSASGLSANESVLNYSFSSIDDSKYMFSNTEYGSGGERGGWLGNGTSGDSVEVSAPFWVVIGDSQAEGAPALDGRLSNGGFDYDFPDQSGQLSFHLRELTNMRWFNHGIGSQNSAQILARFQRDALGKTFAVGDGRGDRTLSGPPQGIVLIAGINDFYTGLTVSDLQENLTAMASLANQEGIPLVVLNCPGDEINNATQNLQVDSINNWLSAGNLNAYGAVIVDYNAWWRNPSYDDNFHANSLIVDDIHPSQVGYDSLANYIYREAALPRLDSIYIYTELSPDGFSGYSRPSAIRIDGEQVLSIANDTQSIAITTPFVSDSIHLLIQSSVNITGTTYTGISHVEYLVSNAYAGSVVTRRQKQIVTNSGGTSKWTESSNNLYPAESETVSIGTSSADGDAVLTIRGTTSDNRAGLVFEDNTGANKIQFYNSGRLGINKNPVYNFDVSGTVNFQNGSNYTFINGSTYQIYGSPSFDFQSTAIGGYRQVTMSFTASLGDSHFFDWKPRASPNGGTTNYRFYADGDGSQPFCIIDGVSKGIRISEGSLTGQAVYSFETDRDIALIGSLGGDEIGRLHFFEAANINTESIALRAPFSLTTNREYILPENYTAGQVLKVAAGDSLYFDDIGVTTFWTDNGDGITYSSSSNTPVTITSTDPLAGVIIEDTNTTIPEAIRRIGDNMSLLPNGGKVGFGGISSPSASIDVQPENSSEPALIARAVSSQSDDIAQVLASNGDKYFAVNSGGNLIINEKQIRPALVQTSDFDPDAATYLYVVDVSGGTISSTLPNASLYDSGTIFCEFVLLNATGSENWILTSGGGQINQAASQTYTSNLKGRIVAINSNWYIF